MDLLGVDASDFVYFLKARCKALLHLRSQAHEFRRKVKFVVIIHVSPSNICFFLPGPLFLLFPGRVKAGIDKLAAGLKAPVLIKVLGLRRKVGHVGRQALGVQVDTKLGEQRASQRCV